MAKFVLEGMCPWGYVSLGVCVQGLKGKGVKWPRDIMNALYCLGSSYAWRLKGLGIYGANLPIQLAPYKYPDVAYYADIGNEKICQRVSGPRKDIWKCSIQRDSMLQNVS